MRLMLKNSFLIKSLAQQKLKNFYVTCFNPNKKKYLKIIIFLDQACTPNLCFSYFSLPIVNPFNLHLSYFIQFSTTPLPLSPYGPPL